MALTKVTTKGITDNAVDGDKLAPGSVTTAKIGPSAVESSEIGNGTVTADDLASTLDLSPKTVTLSGATVSSLKRPVQDNIALLGFKMAVNDGLTVFNLVDGVVDEFHDESGTDESEGSNDHYCATNDVYSNNLSSLSAGFTTTSITEPDTSTTGSNATFGSGEMGTYTVQPTNTSVNIFVWGAGGGIGTNICASSFPGTTGGGGGGGFASGTLAVTGGQTLKVGAGEGGDNGNNLNAMSGGGEGGGDGQSPGCNGGGGGGGLSGVFSADIYEQSQPQWSAPTAYVVAGSGGGFVGANPTDNSGPGSSPGGAGGGLTGDAGGQATEQVNSAGYNNAPQAGGYNTGGGGDQEQGGQGASPSISYCAAVANGSLFRGGCSANHSTSTRGGAGGGGAGYYGGGRGYICRPNPICRQGGGGGGSSFHGHPQITSGATEEGSYSTGGGTSDPNYQAGTNEGIEHDNPAPAVGEDGFVLITASNFGAPGGGSTTLVSTAFSANSVPTSSRIVVFEENVDTPTLNTDIIASISRDGGSTYTNATLSDSGYVTGSSGQRILTGQATISGQPSGQSMRWKLALANNTVKIHGVALQWS